MRWIVTDEDLIEYFDKNPDNENLAKDKILITTTNKIYIFFERGEFWGCYNI